MNTPALARTFAFLAVFCTIVAYYPSLKGDFFSDDFVYVAGNESLQLPISECWKLFVSPANPFEFLPVRDLSYWVDTVLFGEDPSGYHAHNLLIYALTCVAVWFCTISLLRFFIRYGRGLPDSKNKREWIAAATTTLFAVHPAHVESVAWISGRKDLLAGFFCVVSLHFFISALLPARVDPLKIISAYLLFILALLSKAAFMPLALIALLLAGVRCKSEKIHGPQSWIRGGVLAAPMLLLAVGSLLLNMFIGGETGITTVEGLEGSRPSAPLLAVRILGYLVEIALFPIRLHLTYDVLQPGMPAVFALLLGSGALIATLIGLVFLLKRQSIVAFGVVTFGLFCLPYLQLIPFRTWSLASERFVFFALYGLVLLLAIFLSKLPALPSTLLLTVLAIAGIGLTYNQSLIWSNSDALWMNNAKKEPGLGLAQMNAIDSALLPKGRFVEAEALAVQVRDPLWRNLLLHYVAAKRAIAEGDWTRAEQETDWLAKLAGTNGPQEILFFLGSAYEKQNRHSEAARYYYRAAKTPYSSQDRKIAQAGLARIQAHHQDRIDGLTQNVAAFPGKLGPAGELANLQMQLYFLEQAEASFQELLRSNPGHSAILYNLGLTYKRMGEDCLAAEQFRAALQAGFRGSDALNNLGLASWKCEDFEGAASAFQEALASNPQFWHAALNQGRMLLAQGEREKAKSSFLEAKRRISLTGGSTEMVDPYLEMLEAD